MGIFSNIWNKITGKDRDDDKDAHGGKTGASQGGAVGQASGKTATGGGQPVDVEAILAKRAQTKADGGGNYKTSIVDLLKLLDIDPSLDNRKELAEELGVNAGPHGSAEQNIALSRAVWAKIAENGGVVPASLRD